MSSSLTNNAISNIIKTQSHGNDSSFFPIVQILKVLPVQKSQGTQQERYRIILSDGVHLAQGMLATQHNSRVREKELIDLSIIRISDYMTNVIQDKSLVIVLGFDIVNVNPGGKIGNPVPIGNAPIDNSNAGPSNAQWNQQQPQYGGSIVKSEPNGPSSHYQSPPAKNNPYSPANKQYQQSGSIMQSVDPLSSRGITPIANLNLYQNRWTIKARVTLKTDVRHWSNAKGDGQLFSIELLDASNMNIRATFFKEASEKFYPLLEEDKVYTLSGGRLKAANTQYNTCKSQFEITFDMNTEIHSEEDSGEISQQTYEFCPIANLENIEPGKYVDVIGVIKSVTDPSSITSKKTGKEMIKAELVVADDSGAEVNCTVWGDLANKATMQFADTPVVAIRRARVSDYGGRTLSAGGGSNGGIAIRPRISETERVQGWWNGGGSTGGTKSLSSAGGGGKGRFPIFEQRKVISTIKEEHLGQNGGDKPDWISFKGSFSFIKSDKEGGAWYTACPSSEEPCMNRYKVNQQGDGMYFCEKCQQTFPNCMRKFIFSATVSDDSSTTWVSIFDDQARVLFGEGVTADGVYEALNQQGQDAYDAPFSQANFSDWIFTCKVKQEMVQEDMRVKVTVVSIHPVDYAKEGRSLLNSILEMQ